MVMQAAYAVLLARGCGAGRHPRRLPDRRAHRLAQLDDLVGMFVNMLVLRTDLRATRPSANSSRGSGSTDLDAFAHQDLPFERLVDVLAPGPARPPPARSRR